MTNAQSATADDSFVFWMPPAGMTLSTGADEHLELPHIPLPLCTATAPTEADAVPSERLIGEGIYEYLCAHPDTEQAGVYADILRRAYPFLISDVGSQLLLLDLRPRDEVALQTKIPLLKILLQLDEQNFGLLHKLGVTCFNLAVHPEHSSGTTDQLKAARQWLEKARRQKPEDAANLNYLGQVCYLTGNYHQAKLYWQSAVSQLSDQNDRVQLKERLDLLSQGGVPVEPLSHQLEQLGQARRLFASGEVLQAYELVEELVRQGDLARELPSADLYHFIGICREGAQDPAGAYEALMTARQMDDKHEGVVAALERVSPATQQ